MTIQINSDKTAAVETATVWLPVDNHTPRGVKLQLINRHAGVATYSIYSERDTHWTHWHPLPRFERSVPPPKEGE